MLKELHLPIPTTKYISFSKIQSRLHEKSAGFISKIWLERSILYEVP